MNAPAQIVGGNTGEAKRLLNIFHPSDLSVLTSITPDRKTIKTETFNSPADAEAWIDAENRIANCYFNVNPVMGPLSTKAKKADVRGMTWLHTDCDPRAGEDIDLERSRIFSALQNYKPAPTLIIDSGGGYQAFWKLDKEHPINGDEEKAAELEAYNLQIELNLGADSVHNCDRIMRLAGTWNLPDEKKQKKGRKAALASIVEYHPERVYPLSAFTPAARVVQLGDDADFMSAAPEIKIPGYLPPVDLDDLPDAVTQRIKMMVCQGDDPDEPGKYTSRSEALFAVVCALVKANVLDETIASIILDRDFGISASVLDKSRPQDYAARQIKRAKEEAISPHLRKLNDQFFVVGNEGGKCRVCEWKKTECGGKGHVREQLSHQSFADFRNRFMHRPVEDGRDRSGKPRIVPMGDWWLKNQLRRQYEGLVFVPDGQPIINGELNLWRGWGVEPKPGDWSLLKQHVQKVLAAGDPVSADYILRWTAWAFQHPGEPAEAALVFKGKSGTGKGTWGRTMRRAFGHHGIQVNSSKHLTGYFNAHLRDACLVFADEAIMAGDKDAEKILFGMLTEDTIQIEAKGKDTITTTNHLKVIMASNEKWVVPANTEDRRFAVFEVSKVHMKDESYFAALKAAIDGAGTAAMLHDLLNMDLGDWHPRRNIPDTKARNEQKLATLKGFEKVFHQMLRAGELPSNQFGSNGHPFVATSEMLTYVQDRFKYQSDLNEIGELFNILGFEKDRGDHRVRGYELLPLLDAQAIWDRKMAPGNWDQGATEWVSYTKTRDGWVPHEIGLPSAF